MSDLALIALVASGLAAASSALGVLPYRLRRSVAPSGVGFAQAAASGFMLGISYLLLFRGLSLSAVWLIAGSLLGIGYTLAVQTLVGVRELHRENDDGRDPSLGYRALLQDILHSASEGIAIGAALVLSVELGCFMAATLAVHNVGEAMALTQVLRRNRLGLLQLAALAVVSKSSQVLLALLPLALAGAAPDLQPLILGFAAGALLYLVLTELLPASYAALNHRWTAAAASLSAGAVVLLERILI